MPDTTQDGDVIQLPSEPNTLWVGRFNSMWRVDWSGNFYNPGGSTLNPEDYAPFHQLVLK